MARNSPVRSAKILALVPSDASSDEAVPDSILRERYERAGAMLKGLMERECPTIGTWARMHEFSDTTVRQLVNGTYNFPTGASLDLLWRLSLALSGDDGRAAQRVCYEYCAILGMLPSAREISIITELAAVESQVRRIADKVALWH